MAVFDTYKDGTAEWRWRLKANNGHIIADSSEGYASLDGVRTTTRRVKELAPDAEVN